MPERVLVTGANGFVGRATCAALSRAGFTVRAAIRNLDSIQAESFDYKVVAVGDIGPETEWIPALDGVDTVVHLAGRVHVLKETFDDPLAEFHQIYVLGSKNLARTAAGAGVRRLVYVSSIGVNGRATPLQPFTEEHAPVPHNPYAISKWEAEQTLRRTAEETAMELVILRPPLVYGPGVKANFLRLMRLVYRGLPLPLRSVHNRRSLLYVGNLADAIVCCIDHLKAAGEAFLVSDGEDVSTPDLLVCIGTALGQSVRLLPFPPSLLRGAGRLSGRLSNVEPLLDSLVVDSSKIRRTLDWRPPYTMAQGLKETAVWFNGAKPRA